MKKLCVDRIVENIVVCECEDMSYEKYSLTDFPFEIHEGSMVILDDDGSLKPDGEGENERRQEVIRIQNLIKKGLS